MMRTLLACKIFEIHEMRANLAENTPRDIMMWVTYDVRKASGILESNLFIKP